MPTSVAAPWGTWEVLADAPGYKVKKITINSGHRLSYQKHCRRSELWLILRGTATITLDGQELELNAGGHIAIPRESAHRIANRCNEPVVLIEVQQGNYCEEDDIIRFEDDYGRVSG